MRKKAIYSLCAACCLLAALSMPASALEYTIDAPEAGPFGTPTSDDTVYLTRDEPMNTDRSKTAAVIPPSVLVAAKPQAASRKRAMTLRNIFRLPQT